MRKRLLLTCITVTALLLSAAPAEAKSEGVGLGVSVGAVFPNSENLDMDEVGLAWGFWVDIPIAWKFHIAPAAEIYNLGGDDVGENTATDITLNFKFIIPLGFVKPFFGAGGGVTNAMNQYNANAGLLAGASFKLVANLEAFVAAKYKVIIHDPNVHMLHTSAGVLFVF